MNSSSLDFSEFPDKHQEHACGSAPFVPDVSNDRQNSCGSYSAAFNKEGCNEYRPNYPDDLYLLDHGCEGLEDCYNGVPTPPNKLPRQREQMKWPAGGFDNSVVQGKKLGFLEEQFGGGCCGSYAVIWVIIILMLFMFLRRR